MAAIRPGKRHYGNAEAAFLRREVADLETIIAAAQAEKNEDNQRWDAETQRLESELQLAAWVAV